jgi:hypothetical protein
VLSHKTNLDSGAIYRGGTGTVAAQASQYPFCERALASGKTALSDSRLLLQYLTSDLLSVFTSFRPNPLMLFTSEIL